MLMDFNGFLRSWNRFSMACYWTSIGWSIWIRSISWFWWTHIKFSGISKILVSLIGEFWWNANALQELFDNPFKPWRESVEFSFLLFNCRWNGMDSPSSQASSINQPFLRQSFLWKSRDSLDGMRVCTEIFTGMFSFSRVGENSSDSWRISWLFSVSS